MFRLEYIDSGDIRDLRRYDQFRGPAIFLATRCYGGKASSNANPVTTTQSGSGQQAAGSNSVAGGQGSLNVGAGAAYAEQGATQAGGNITGTASTNLSDITNTGGSINITDNGAVAAATALAGRTVEDTTGAFNNALTAYNQNLGNILGSVNNLASTAQAGQNAMPLTNYLYLGLAAFAVLAIWLIFGRKH